MFSPIQQSSNSHHQDEDNIFVANSKKASPKKSRLEHATVSRDGGWEDPNVAHFEGGEYGHSKRVCWIIG